MKDQLERIRLAEEKLAELAAIDDPAATARRLRRRFRRSIGATLLLILLAFVALLPLGAALGLVVRVLRRMLLG